jgi:PleD family two-component response regulator
MESASFTAGTRRGGYFMEFMRGQSGLASFPRDGQTVDDLFARADAALLNAKRSGKNRLYLVGRPQNDISNM